MKKLIIVFSLFANFSIVSFSQIPDSVDFLSSWRDHLLNNDVSVEEFEQLAADLL